jgi:perosamine synthetase
MAVTADTELAARMRLMSLHGLSKDAWDRYSANGSWDYRILAPGYKYNLTDVAAAIGIHQLERAEDMRRTRETIAEEYIERLGDLEELDLPTTDRDRLHAWHLFPIRLRLDALAIDRNRFINELGQAGIACSVHWRPLHLHPYYERTFGWCPGDLPTASAVWMRLVSLPLFSTMRRDEIDAVIGAVRSVCQRWSRARKPKGFTLERYREPNDADCGG